MTSAVIAFLLTALVIELTPGPNMAYLAIVSAVEGQRAGLAAVAGVALGLAIVGAAAAVGLAAVIDASPTAYAILRWGGVVYLAYLAIEAWWGAGEISPERAVLDGDVARHFRRGLVINLLNPKAGLFFIVVLPGFVVPGDRVTVQTILLTGIYVVLATVIHGAIVLFSSFARPWFTDPRRQRVARRSFAVLLAGVAAWFFIVTRS